MHGETGASTDESSPHPALASPFIVTCRCLCRALDAPTRRGRYVRENGGGERGKRFARASQIETLKNQFVVTAPAKKNEKTETLASKRRPLPPLESDGCAQSGSSLAHERGEGEG